MRILSGSPAFPKPLTEEKVLLAEQPVVLEQGHVYVHCHFNNGAEENLIRIWRSTFLIDQGSGQRSALVHAENITIAPQWTPVPKNKSFRFLLIFNALPNTCSMFDMLEDIPEQGGFFIRDILRNESDVYHVHLND
jgi:hypothetical protein